MDLFLTIILGVVQLSLAALGIIVAFMSNEKLSQYKWWVVVVFIAFGLLGIGVAGYQQYRIGEESTKQQEKFDGLKYNLDQSRLAQEYMKGQLTAIGTIMGKVSRSVSDPGLKEVAIAIEKMTQSAYQTKMATNKQICSDTMDLVKRMQKLDYEYSQSFSMLSLEQLFGRREAKLDEKFHELHSRLSNEYRTTFLEEAIFLRDELLKRLPPQPKPNDPFMESNFKGQLDGPHPVGNTASYLETLSKKLCPD